MTNREDFIPFGKFYDFFWTDKFKECKIIRYEKALLVGLRNLKSEVPQVINAL